MILTNVQFLEFIYPKIFFAVITGSIIGFERGSRKAAAGFKTHILICLGSMFYTVVPVVLGKDMVVSDQHVIAQIVTGIGFLGAGAIIRNTATEKQPVQGLTTAADIWLVAALGILVGLGFGWSVVLISVIVVSITVTSRHIERRFINQSLQKKPKESGIEKLIKKSEENDL
jgi:putative Mg2+ transporter-C (MgtC) family protein